MLLVGFSEKSIIRLFFLFGLFVLLLKGHSFAKYFLGVIYLLSGVLMTALFFGSTSNVGYASFCCVTAVISFLSSVYFFRSTLLKALTQKKSK